MQLPVYLYPDYIILLHVFSFSQDLNKTFQYVKPCFKAHTQSEQTGNPRLVKVQCELYSPGVRLILG